MSMPAHSAGKVPFSELFARSKNQKLLPVESKASEVIVRSGFPQLAGRDPARAIHHALRESGIVLESSEHAVVMHCS